MNKKLPQEIIPNVIIFNTIAQLRLATKCAELVIVKGYYNDNDGGGGQFYWDPESTEQDNNGTIFKALSITTGRWKRFLTESIAVAWFGAKADGREDDSAAIQAAIRVAGDTGIGQVRLKPAGFHAIAKTIFVGANDCSIILSGSGFLNGQSRLIAKSGFTGEMINLLTGTLDNFSIQGSSTLISKHKGIVIGKTSIPIPSESHNDFKNDANPNVRVQNIRYAGGLYDFIYSEFQFDTSIFNNISGFDEVGHAMIWLDTRLKFPPSSSVNIKNIHFSNDIEHPVIGKKKWGIYVSNTINLKIKSSMINNFDINIELGKARTIKNYCLKLQGIHIEDKRSMLINNKYESCISWTKERHYSKGDYVIPSLEKNNSHYYICSDNPVNDRTGCSSHQEPTWNTRNGATVSDNNLEWTEVGISCIWKINTEYSVGDYIRPSSKNVNGHFYICTKAGSSSRLSEPAWPVRNAATVSDSSVRWQEAGCSIAIKLRLNDNINLDQLWIDGPIIAFYSKESNTTKVTNSNITAKDVAYIQTKGQSSFEYDNCYSSGDLRLKAGGFTTKYLAKNTTIVNDRTESVPNTSSGYYSNTPFFAKLSAQLRKITRMT